MKHPAISRKDLARSMPLGLAQLHDPHFEATPLTKLQNQVWLDVAAGKLDRVAVIAPPRHGKTYLAKYALAWWLGNWPDHNIMTGSYALDLAKHLGREVRDLISEWGPQLWGVDVRGDVGSAKDWQTTSGGGMLAGGRLGGFTGRGAQVAYVDDVLKNPKEAESETVQQEAYTFIKTTLQTRLEGKDGRDGAVVLTNTRWHELDPIGRLLDEEAHRWTVYRVPAIADHKSSDGRSDTGSDPVGRPLGAALWPARFGLPLLEDRRRSQGVYAFNAIYQGLPGAADGRLFRKADFQYWWWHNPERTVLALEGPAGIRLLAWEECHVVHVMDTAGTEKLVDNEPDYTVISSWLLGPGGELVLLDVDRRQTETTSHEAMVRRALSAYRGTLYIEKKMFGLSLLQQLKRTGLSIAPVDADTNKVARARAIQARYSVRMVWHPHPGKVPAAAEWLTDWENEFLRFPKGKHDDQVDTGGYAAGLQATWVEPRIR